MREIPIGPGNLGALRLRARSTGTLEVLERCCDPFGVDGMKGDISRYNWNINGHRWSYMA